MNALEAKKISDENTSSENTFKRIIAQIEERAKNGKYWLEIRKRVVRYPDCRLTAVGEKLVELGYKIEKYPLMGAYEFRTHCIISWQNPTA